MEMFSNFFDISMKMSMSLTNCPSIICRSSSFHRATVCFYPFLSFMWSMHIFSVKST